MKYGQFLKKQGINFSEASRRLGFSHQGHRLWAEEKRLPKREVQIQLAIWSNGEVLPQDWVEVPEEYQLRRAKDLLEKNGYQILSPTREVA